MVNFERYRRIYFFSLNINTLENYSTSKEISELEIILYTTS